MGVKVNATGRTVETEFTRLSKIPQPPAQPTSVQQPVNSRRKLPPIPTRVGAKRVKSGRKPPLPKRPDGKNTKRVVTLSPPPFQPGAGTQPPPQPPTTRPMARTSPPPNPSEIPEDLLRTYRNMLKYRVSHANIRSRMKADGVDENMFDLVLNSSGNQAPSTMRAPPPFRAELLRNKTLLTAPKKQKKKERRCSKWRVLFNAPGVQSAFHQEEEEEDSYNQDWDTDSSEL